LAAAAEGNAIVADSGAADRDALLRLVRAEALRAEGRAEEAASVIARALDRLRARGHAISDPAVRQAFLSRIPENARTVELARQWGVDADAIRG
jgi:hypothetical protein